MDWNKFSSLISIIIETCRESGVPINELYEYGAIASNNNFMMQINADVCNIELKNAESYNKFYEEYRHATICNFVIK